MRRRVAGHEHLDELTGPVVFVANHNSHIDTPVILRALPSRWRRRTAVAAASDYFYDRRRKAVSASLVFGTVPLDRNSGAGVGPGQTAHIVRLFEGGGSLIVYAEGTRSRDGRVGRLRSGAAMLAAEHDLPVVPVYVSGTAKAMPRGRHWPIFKTGRPGPRHQIEIRFGEPIEPGPGERPSQVMERVRRFLADCGAETESEPQAEDAQRRQPA